MQRPKKWVVVDADIQDRLKEWKRKKESYNNVLERILDQVDKDHGDGIYEDDDYEEEEKPRVRVKSFEEQQLLSKPIPVKQIIPEPKPISNHIPVNIPTPKLHYDLSNRFGDTKIREGYNIIDRNQFDIKQIQRREIKDATEKE